MADIKLDNCKVAVLATDGFEESELFEPLKALKNAGADVKIVSIKDGLIKAWNHDKWGKEIKVDLNVKNANPAEFNALVLPGGVMNPDRLRMDPDAVEFVRVFSQEGKPIAAICHGPWTLVEADVVGGKHLTSWPSLKTDLKNAGALWEDKEVVTDKGLITSRKPADLPAFCSKMLEEFAEGTHGVSRTTQTQQQQARPQNPLH